LKTRHNSMHCIRILWRQDIIQSIASEFFEDTAYFKASHLNSMNMGPASLHLICILWKQDLFHYNASDFCTRFYQVTVAAKNSTPEFFMRFFYFLQPSYMFVLTRLRHCYTNNIVASVNCDIMKLPLRSKCIPEHFAVIHYALLAE
jgi:hypothetical protein